MDKMAASIKEYLIMPAMGEPDLNGTINQVEAPTQIQCAVPEPQPDNESPSPLLWVPLIVLVFITFLLCVECRVAQQQKEVNTNLRKINSELTTGMAELKKKGQKKEQEAAKKVADLEEEKAELMKKARKDQEEAGNEIADLQQTNSELKTDEQSRKRKVQDLIETNSELTTGMAALMEKRQEEQEKAAKEIADLKGTISELKTNAQKFESERSKSEKQVTDLQAIESELQADAQKSKSEISKLEKQVTTLKKDLEDYEHRVDARDTLLLESNMQLESTQGDLDAANDTISGQQQRITGLEADNQRIQNRNEHLADDNAQLQIKLGQRGIKLVELKEENAKLHAKISSSKAALEL